MAGDKQKHILVIEDSRILREAIQDLLAQEGFKITAADGGAGARGLLETRAADFDLIVVNLQVAPASQFDALEWLRARRSNLPIPILAITGPARMALAVERLRGLEAAGVQDTRTMWDQLPYRVRTLLNPKETDQRAAVRMPSGLPVNVRMGSTATQGVIGNLSSVGMFVRLEVPLPLGQEVVLQFILPDIPRLFEAQARVVWTARRDAGATVPGMGVEFLSLDSVASGQINAFVRMELEKFAPTPAA